MPEMTPRERMLLAIQHEQPDRVPIFLGADLTTGMVAGAYRRLAARLELSEVEMPLYDWPELGAPRLSEAALRRLHSDVRGVQDRFPAATYQRNRSRPDHSAYCDDWGVGQPEIEPGMYFPAIHPLAQAEQIEEIRAYPHWPDMDDPSRFSHLRGEVEKLAGEGRYAIAAAPWLLSPLERACQLQGMQTFLINLIEQPDFASHLLWKIESLCKQHLSHFLAALDDKADLLILADDLGTQTNLLISPRTYRQILKPVHADLIAFVKSRSRLKIFFHSDGDIFPLIDDLVEIGVDILNPIQTSAGRMADLAGLKQRYGSSLVFCGAIDTQHILPRGTPAQVRDEVRRVIRLLGTGGGYLLGPVHSIPPETPPENILAMVDAAVEFGRYPLG